MKLYYRTCFYCEEITFKSGNLPPVYGRNPIPICQKCLDAIYEGIGEDFAIGGLDNIEPHYELDRIFYIKMIERALLQHSQRHARRN